MNSSKKKYTITKLKKELWKVVAAKIKERDHYTCWHCGKKMDNPSALHCSHILPKGQYKNYEFCSWNLKTLCMGCHLQWWHKNPIEASLWLRTEHPDVYKRALEEVKNYKNTKKKTMDDLLALKLKLDIL
jgi:5-methylcytosine-specific restriction endonuclease McrA